MWNYWSLGVSHLPSARRRNFSSAIYHPRALRDGNNPHNQARKAFMPGCQFLDLWIELLRKPYTARCAASGAKVRRCRNVATTANNIIRGNQFLDLGQNYYGNHIRRDIRADGLKVKRSRNFAITANNRYPHAKMPKRNTHSNNWRHYIK